MKAINFFGCASITANMTMLVMSAYEIVIAFWMPTNAHPLLNLAVGHGVASFCSMR